jgi:hypothetical protein
MNHCGMYYSHCVQPIIHRKNVAFYIVGKLDIYICTVSTHLYMKISCSLKKG